MRRAAPPHLRFHRGPRWHVDRLPQREEDGEPREHVWRERRRMGIEGHILVQLTLKVACEPAGWKMRIWRS